MTTKTPIKKRPQTPRIPVEQYKEDLQVLATVTPKELVKAVVQGFGFKKESKSIPHRG